MTARDPEVKETIVTPNDFTQEMNEHIVLVQVVRSDICVAAGICFNGKATPKPHFLEGPGQTAAPGEQLSRPDWAADTLAL